ncbi:MAG: PIN domain-containing protein [Planctomycetes bacterium]|nr:PIN domain-containing protein [Planctomycetota bacterium]
MEEEVVIVDTSVWIDVLRSRPSMHREEVSRLVRLDRAGICSLILAEILEGIRSAKEEEEVRRRLSVVRSLPIAESVWEEAGRLGAALRRKGITVPLSDRVIAIVALRQNCPVYTVDKHFQRIPSLRLYAAR